MIETYIKITGCVLIISSSSGMGFLLANDIRKRLEDLRSAKTIALLLRGDIRYAHTALPEALENVARRHDGRMSPFLKRVARELHKYNGLSFTEIWKQAMEEELKNTSLSKKDKVSLLQFGEQLGYLDKDMQINHIDWYIAQLDDDMKEITSEAKDKMRLYKSLGVLFGILVTILLV
ncbi:MAG: stage III sporulation protein AB [Clostridiales bacterium]|nr:stage III sporulation protein AB [Clostridiales bacterium]